MTDATTPPAAKVDDAFARARALLEAEAKATYEKGVEAVRATMKEHGLDIATQVIAQVGQDGLTRYVAGYQFVPAA